MWERGEGALAAVRDGARSSRRRQIRVWTFSGLDVTGRRGACEGNDLVLAIIRNRFAAGAISQTDRDNLREALASAAELEPPYGDVLRWSLNRVQDRLDHADLHEAAHELQFAHNVPGLGSPQDPGRPPAAYPGSDIATSLRLICCDQPHHNPLPSSRRSTRHMLKTVGVMKAATLALGRRHACELAAPHDEHGVEQRTETAGARGS